MQISAQISRFHGTGVPFEVCEVPVIATPEDTLVRVSLATICGSDLHTVSGRRDAPTPCVLGHEAVGTIAAPTRHRSATGEPLREGDRVTWSLMASCGTCDYCTDRNLPQKCGTLFKYGHARSEGSTTLSGGFATHILLRQGTAIYRIPDGITDKEVVPINWCACDRCKRLENHRHISQRGWGHSRCRYVRHLCSVLSKGTRLQNDCCCRY